MRRGGSRDEGVFTESPFQMKRPVLFCFILMHLQIVEFKTPSLSHKAHFQNAMAVSPLVMGELVALLAKADGPRIPL